MPVMTYTMRLVVEVFPRRTGGDDGRKLLDAARAIFAGNTQSVFLGIEDGRTICRASGFAEAADPEFQHRIKALVDLASSDPTD